MGSVRKNTGGIHESVKRLAYTLRKEVELMPIILTIHVFGYTVTVRIVKKSNNRHSVYFQGTEFLEVSIFMGTFYVASVIHKRWTNPGQKIGNNI